MNRLSPKPAFLFLFLLFVACTDDGFNLEQAKMELEQNMVTDLWSITTFTEAGDNQRSQFDAYTFTFATDGSLTAVSNDTSCTGIWIVTANNSNDEGLADLGFNLAFPTSTIFAELNGEWAIQSESDTKIELFDGSGGNGETNYLTFEKP